MRRDKKLRLERTCCTLFLNWKHYTFFFAAFTRMRVLMTQVTKNGNVFVMKNWKHTRAEGWVTFPATTKNGGIMAPTRNCDCGGLLRKTAEIYWYWYNHQRRVYILLGRCIVDIQSCFFQFWPNSQTKSLKQIPTWTRDDLDVVMALLRFSLRGPSTTELFAVKMKDCWIGYSWAIYNASTNC